MRFALVREFAFSALAIGAKAGKSMSERTRRYTEGEIGNLRVVEDFLPPPAASPARGYGEGHPGPQQAKRGLLQEGGGKGARPLSAHDSRPSRCLYREGRQVGKVRHGSAAKRRRFTGIIALLRIEIDACTLQPGGNLLLGSLRVQTCRGALVKPLWSPI